MGLAISPETHLPVVREVSYPPQGLVLGSTGETIAFPLPQTAAWCTSMDASLVGTEVVSVGNVALQPKQFANAAQVGKFLAEKLKITRHQKSSGGSGILSIQFGCFAPPASGGDDALESSSSSASSSSLGHGYVQMAAEPSAWARLRQATADAESSSFSPSSPSSPPSSTSWGRVENLLCVGTAILFPFLGAEDVCRSCLRVSRTWRRASLNRLSASPLRLDGDVVDTSSDEDTYNMTYEAIDLFCNIKRVVGPSWPHPYISLPAGDVYLPSDSPDPGCFATEVYMPAPDVWGEYLVVKQHYGPLRFVGAAAAPADDSYPTKLIGNVHVTALASLSLQQCQVTGMEGPTIQCVGGSVHLSQCEITGRRGEGIYVRSGVLPRDDDTAGEYDAILARGTVTAKRCTIRMNGLNGIRADWLGHACLTFCSLPYSFQGAALALDGGRIVLDQRYDGDPESDGLQSTLQARACACAVARGADYGMLAKSEGSQILVKCYEGWEQKQLAKFEGPAVDPASYLPLYIERDGGRVTIESKRPSPRPNKRARKEGGK